MYGYILRSRLEFMKIKVSNTNFMFLDITAETWKLQLFHPTHYTVYIIFMFRLIFKWPFDLFSDLLLNIESVVLRDEVYQRDLLQTFAVLHYTLFHEGI